MGEMERTVNIRILGKLRIYGLFEFFVRSSNLALLVTAKSVELKVRGEGGSIRGLSLSAPMDFSRLGAKTHFSLHVCGRTQPGLRAWEHQTQ